MNTVHNIEADCEKSESPKNLRSADSLIHELQKDYPEVYKYLTEKISQKDKNGKYIYYPGIRNNSLILYYL